MKWFHYTSYDYLIKLCRLLGVNMLPMHLMVKMRRLEYFGHIVRMKDCRLLKQLLFGEVAGHSRPQCRPRTAWIDCIKKDLADFGICESGDNLQSEESWLKLKALAEDRQQWRTSVKSVGIKHALDVWYYSNTVRRSKRMAREGEEMIECFEPAYDQLCEDPEYDKLSRTPLEIVPNGVIGKLLRDLGSVVSNNIMNEVNRVQLKEPRPENDYEKWCDPFITERVLEHANAKEDAMRKTKHCDRVLARKIVRDEQIAVWMPTSNVYNDRDEMFVIEKIVGYHSARPRQYKVQWAPRFFDADADFPDELPEVRGLDWPPDIVNSWMPASSLERSHKDDPDCLAELKAWKDGVMVGGGVEGGGME